MRRPREPVEELFPRGSAVVYRVAVGTVGRVVRLNYGVTVEGIDHIPATGPVIVAANHVSFLDPVAITSVLPRRITYLAKAELFASRTSGWLFSVAGQIPVHRDDPRNDEPMLAGLAVLQRDGVLGVHPEGSRSPDGRLYRGRTGVARLAADSGAPVVCAGVSGTHAIYPRDRRFPRMRGRIAVRFGAPFTYGGSGMRPFTDEVMRKIAALSGQEYVDRYSVDFSLRRSSGPR